MYTIDQELRAHRADRGGAFEAFCRLVPVQSRHPAVNGHGQLYRDRIPFQNPVLSLYREQIAPRSQCFVTGCALRRRSS